MKNGSCRTCPKVRRSGLCRFRRFPSLLGEPIFAIYEKAGPEAVLHNRLLLVRGARVALHFCRRVRGCDRARHAAPVEAFDY